MTAQRPSLTSARGRIKVDKKRRGRGRAFGRRDRHVLWPDRRDRRHGLSLPRSSKSLIKLIRKNSPAIREDAAEELAALFLDLQKKCENAEISSKALDLRGLLGAIDLMEKGLDIHTALDMGIANKSFDPYEQTLIRDTIQARISRKIQRKDVFRKK